MSRSLSLERRLPATYLLTLYHDIHHEQTTVTSEDKVVRVVPSAAVATRLPSRSRDNEKWVFVSG